MRWIVLGVAFLAAVVSWGAYLTKPSSNDKYFSAPVDLSQTSVATDSPTPTTASNLPPDPGTTGKATLAGIDSDHDGVRDDVQRYIALTYPQSARQRAALIQEAVFFQSLVVGGGTTQSNLQQQLAAEDCLSYTFMTGGADDVAGGLQASDAGHALTAVVMNTPDRAKAFAHADAQFNGTVVFMTPHAQQALHCKIPPASLPN